MFCVGAKITFADGRIAAARNAEEMEKIFAMSASFTAINCFADSIGLVGTLSENGGTFVWTNRDNGEKYTTTASSFDEVKKISEHFIKSGERCPDFSWEKV